MSEQAADNDYLKEAIEAAKPVQFPDFNAIADKLASDARQPRGHSWRQRGPHLVCVSCPQSHSQHIGMEKLLQGFDENGAPILKNRW